MYMDVGMDTGDMILKEKVSIGENETTGELWDRLSKIGGELLVKTLKLIEDGNAPRTKQGEDYTIAPMLDKEMANIDWENKTAEQIKNLIRGLNPIMGAYTFVNGKKLKIWKAQVVEENKILVSDNKIKNGDIVLADAKQGLFFKAKDGMLEAIEIQAENCKRMNAKDFLRGNKL